MQTRQRILVLADPATGSPELVATLRRNGAEAPTSFTLLVTAADGGSAGGWSRAISRATQARAQARRAGIELEETIVGDPDPALAVGDALHARDFDRVVTAGGERVGAALAAEPLALAA
jgi:hypothetical protein